MEVSRSAHLRDKPAPCSRRLVLNPQWRTDRFLIIECNAERLYAFVTELFVMAGFGHGV
jgi:hypothetical protein